MSETLADSKSPSPNEQEQINEHVIEEDFDAPRHCDYSDYMTATLREAKAKLSEMVKRASRGEEVVITVHGKETAKIVPVPKRRKKRDKEKWLAELDELRRKYSTGKIGISAQEIQDSDREDRF
jgi:prevent-host-death family protein